MKLRHYVSLATLMAGMVGIAGVSAVRAEDGAGTYEVTGVKSIHHLNIRASGSLEAAVLGGASNGEKLKSTGCKDGWCAVETEKGLKGFSSAKYLKMAMAAAAAAPAAASPSKFSIGTLKCERSNGSPVMDCNYGLMRVGTDMYRLQVIWPDATKRMFGIYQKTVTSIDGPVTAKVGDDSSYDLTLTPAGMPSEHFMVSGDVMTGKK